MVTRSIQEHHKTAAIAKQSLKRKVVAIATEAQEYKRRNLPAQRRAPLIIEDVNDIPKEYAEEAPGVVQPPSFGYRKNRVVPGV